MNLLLARPRLSHTPNQILVSVEEHLEYLKTISEAEIERDSFSALLKIPEDDVTYEKRERPPREAINVYPKVLLPRSS